MGPNIDYYLWFCCFWELLGTLIGNILSRVTECGWRLDFGCVGGMERDGVRRGGLEKAGINTVLLLPENRWVKCTGDSWV